MGSRAHYVQHAAQLAASYRLVTNDAVTTHSKSGTHASQQQANAAHFPLSDVIMDVDELNKA